MSPGILSRKLVCFGSRRVFNHEEELIEFDRMVKDLAKNMLKKTRKNQKTLELLMFYHSYARTLYTRMCRMSCVNILTVETCHAQESAIQAHQIERARPSYVQALIIASRGDPRNPECEKCICERDPFMRCYVDNFRGDACVNCVWSNNSAQCQYRTKFLRYLNFLMN